MRTVTNLQKRKLILAKYLNQKMFDFYSGHNKKIFKNEFERPKPTFRSKKLVSPASNTQKMNIQHKLVL